MCEQLDVPLDVVPLTEQYWEHVVGHCIAEVRAGRTPNPDVLCNSRVKFGAFYDFLATQHADAFDRIASGHYARVERAASEPDAASSEAPGVRLALTRDAVKDQTYFLSHLSQRQLSRTLFPLGVLTKGEVRRLAAAAGLPNKDRKDSQGLCFLGKVKFSEFIQVRRPATRAHFLVRRRARCFCTLRGACLPLRDGGAMAQWAAQISSRVCYAQGHLGTWPGPIIDEDSGRAVAVHHGFWFFTVGQRTGLDLGTLANGPWYVVRKDARNNAVFVSRDYHAADKARDRFECDSLNWIEAPPPEVQLGKCASGGQVHVKVRHGPEAYAVLELRVLDDGARVAVALPCNDQGLAAGQFAAFYRDGVCLGSGVICSTGT